MGSHQSERLHIHPAPYHNHIVNIETNPMLLHAQDSSLQSHKGLLAKFMDQEMGMQLDGC